MMHRRLLLALLILAACKRDEPPAPPPPKPPPPPAAASAGRNLAMGMGEVRETQPFTMEQRLLDAVRRDDRPTIEKALERGATVGAKDDLQRWTVLLAVKDAKDLELVRWLHGKGAAIDETGRGGVPSSTQRSGITPTSSSTCSIIAPIPTCAISSATRRSWWRARRAMRRRPRCCSRAAPIRR